MKRMIFSTAVIALLFSSCKKEDDLVSRKDVLTTGKWTITAHATTYYINGVYHSKDYYADYVDCEKETLISFPKEDDSYIKYIPGIHCNSGSATSGWFPLYPIYRLEKNSSVLRYYDEQNNAHDFTIDYMDKDILKTTSKRSSSNYSEEIILNYKHVD